MKRVLLAVAIVLAVLMAAYGYGVTRRERQFRQAVFEGDLAVAKGDTAAAVAAFSDAISLHPESMLGHLKRGDAHRRAGDLEASALDLEHARELNPTEPRVLELLGDVAAARQLHDLAALYYAASVGLDDRPRVLYKLALARHLGGQHAAAADVLRQAVKMDGRFAEAHYLLGLCLRATGDLSAAQSAFDRAVTANPALLSARDQLADVYGLLGRRADRIKQLEDLLHADSSAQRQVTLAVAYAESGQVWRGVRMLRFASELYPTHPGTYLALAKIRLDAAEADPAEGRRAVAEAVAAVTQAMAIETSSAALTLLGRARLLASDAPAAERTLRQATELRPVEPSAFLYLADAADRASHPWVVRRALLDYQRLTGANDPDFLVRLAEAHWRVGDPVSARTVLATALRADPDHASGLDLEQRLR